MKDKEISLVLKKAEELKALFVLGQRVIPFLEEIFVFVSEIKPVLDDINVSIEENLKKMPSASKQLSKVTEATELATTEIMDIVDGIVYKSDIIKTHVKKINERGSDSAGPLKILKIVYKALKSGADTQKLLPQMKKAIVGFSVKNDDDSSEAFGKTNEMLDSVIMDANSIMISLQVQDITSQQIAAVNHLLETIQDKLSNILVKFNQTNVEDLVDPMRDREEDINVSRLHREIAFDPEAVDSISVKDSRQGEVDEYMQRHNNGEDIFDEDEGETDEAESEPQAEEEDAEASSETDDGPASQDDIDALFQAVNGDDDENYEEENDGEVVDDPPATQEIEESVGEESPADSEPDDRQSPEPEPVEEDDEEDEFQQFSQDDIDALFGK